MSGGDDDSKKEGSQAGELIRHVLYVGGMVALHAGFGATATVAGAPSKCPLGEWARHAVYVGGFVALAIKAGMAAKPAIKDEEKVEGKACPVNELYRHTVYIAGMVGVVALMNSRKK
ncbi:expressed unknown protein [Seminavis robusta]|uniref:Uncharacterized protein n=1 Tax=Seminavis robusta TaxID=568900 RepID=A0A9N8HL29_9STRA|nr:expressed unknown protein [Seminavis robusta]|eukprot:Sro882_g215350.1 n/a (117) ;mRNA; r:24655-25005